MEAEGEDWDPIKIALAPSSPSTPVIHYWPFQGGTFIVVHFIYCIVVFHFLSWLYTQLRAPYSPEIYIIYLRKFW